MINWRYVKGLNENNGASPLYTFLLFCWKRNSTLLHFDNVPELKYSETNNITANLINPANTDNSWGHIITERATGQFINTAFQFNSSVKIGKISNNTWVGSIFNYDATNHQLDISSYSSTSAEIRFNWYNDSSSPENYISFSRSNASFKTTITVSKYINIGSAASHTNNGDLSAKNIYTDSTINSGGKLTVSSGGAAITGGAVITGNASVSGTTTSGGKLTVSSGGASITGDIVGSAKCQAAYFNATSDKRAKTNLKPLSINALDLIKRVQLYSFKYKDSDLPSIGILAQDIQDVNIEGFDLVDNKQASGVDMDYMSIHESKLTYILWKAIQEQQKEIDELKAQIKNLTK